ncbi:hypothetical protein Naga_101431g1 [Nannochloropsis gaditana]|uniref:Uncharacterized protein n=1 Tax=Nannochloropsis gaditana TaxID=72520 RepID=W7T0P2_9STRA|nr:hypothetical protein Naga_101431g1 [Nannochloropsis gaditana]
MPHRNPVSPPCTRRQGYKIAVSHSGGGFLSIVGSPWYSSLHAFFSSRPSVRVILVLHKDPSTKRQPRADMTNLIRPVALVDLAAAFARMGRPSSNR